jgi:hypothetical protein
VKSILYVLLTVFIVFSVLTWGCSDDPTTVGIGILPPDDILLIDTLVVYATDAYTFDHRLTTGNSGTIFVGEDEEFRVFGILKLDSLLTQKGIHPDSLRNAEIVEATLLLYPSYYQGDSAATISIEAYAIESGWVTTNFNRDVFESLRIGSEIQSNTAEPVMLGDTNAIALPLSKELIIYWADLSQQKIESNGLILQPTGPSNGLIGFSMLSLASNPPQLQIIHGSADAPDTTVFYGFRRAYIGYNKIPISGDDKIVFQAGVSTRSIIHFDLTEIPRGSLVHAATLELTVDENEMLRNDYSADSLQVHVLTDIPKKDFSESYIARFDDFHTEDGIKIIYRSRVGRLLQYLVTVGENKGFLIYDFNDYLGFHRAGFYSPSDAIPERRPKLTIFYSPI